MDDKLPMKASATCTEQISVRVEPELKAKLKKLTYMGVDMPELVRRCVREAVERGLKRLGDDAA